MIELILILQLIILALVAYAARKAFWAARIALDHREAIEEGSLSTTRQLEELDGLYHRLGLVRGSLAPSRGWAASPDFLNILYDHIRERKPAVVFECGSGLSTIVTARALQQNGTGKLFTLEHDAYFAGETDKNLRRLELEGFVEIFLAPLKAAKIGDEEFLWYDRESFAVPHEIDLIVIDGPPAPLAGEEGRYPAGPVLFAELSQRGAVLLDDTRRAGESRVVDRFLSEFAWLTRKDLHAEKGCALLQKAGAD